ncbi:MAG TPA: prepilin peptidase, partial [Longimicrobiales bacterium]
MPPDDLIVMDLAVVWVVLVGATIGSFLNVVIARVPAGQSVVRPRSRCPRCGAQIAWHDNIPIVSWFALRGRCRACRGPISFRYPLVEAAVAAAAVVAFLHHGLTAAALGELVMVALLVALALIDLDTWQLPHALTVPLIAMGLALAAMRRGPAPGLGSAALGAAVGFAAFGMIWFVGEKVLHREAMGLGDAFLLSGIGGWMGLPALLPVVLLASIQGSVVGLVQLLLGKGQPGRPRTGEAPPEAPAMGGASELDGEEEWVPPRHSVPFGPFLAAGALEWLYLSGWLSSAVPLLQVFR